MTSRLNSVVPREHIQSKQDEEWAPLISPTVHGGHCSTDNEAGHIGTTLISCSASGSFPIAYNSSHPDNYNVCSIVGFVYRRQKPVLITCLQQLQPTNCHTGHCSYRRLANASEATNMYDSCMACPSSHPTYLIQLRQHLLIEFFG